MAVAIAVLIVAPSCSMNYPSRSEAESACREWQAQEAKVDYERELLGFEKRIKFEQENPRPDAAFWDDQIIDWEKQKLAYASKTIVESVVMSSRYCQSEQENSRFLGFENDAIKKGTYRDEAGKKGEWRVVKNFRY
ncbi:hypothetical protein [Synechococcus sp. MIT S9508]|uniref:hypothetical protein n=1 Tax=Synechococcus sp. MIT S9508 TaxID=1801629 RepID=UPI000834E229|nr:hypothetical protein [Synechococcus sp. MIT S9508]